ncbi:MAG: prenyltransferase/squalene oxidase repeat-containing protein [Desulfobaccales bacterium]
MIDRLVSDSINLLQKRSLAEGGFTNADNGDYRTDATAWAIIALSACGFDPEIISRARSRLAAGQLADGRVCISPHHPAVYWPTPLAILAWSQSPPHQDSLARAVAFLLEHSGMSLQEQALSADASDPTLRGWPWVADTYSWVDPTALGMIALKVTGHSNHPRLAEATRLLLNRKLPHGGWNYGNTIVFHKELRPMPENTGMALAALKSLTVRSNLELSLDYLKVAVRNLRTPIALSWGILGLGAWGERPLAATTWLSECWGRQARFGVYDTASLSLFILACRLSGGIESLSRLAT